eukprot:CAMPEP_0119126694 /NCGR_PEP_ID=MMETSP1310-20130426/5517_1 /TAXON_ID=464262 /ORGANISM="Genus nov. species nov., Strain RCC2339" /LENGTH=1442 /DNA_ID=CAMNT_0007116865 /DNA_START=62 /DNA_END=4390 /DNA_ORIENTATION=-
MANVILTVVRGRDLCAKDRSGTSDPYVKIWLRKHKDSRDAYAAKSKYILTDLNPTWNWVAYKGAVDDFQKHQIMYFEVWDKDTISSDDFMGCGMVDFSSVTPGKDEDFQVTLVESPAHKGEKVSGSILFRVQFVDGSPSKKEAMDKEFARAFAKEMPVKTHSVRVRHKYEKSFTGGEACEFLRRKHAISEEEINDRLVAMLKCRVFVPVRANRFTFKTSVIYKFNSEDNWYLPGEDDLVAEDLAFNSAMQSTGVSSDMGDLKSIPAGPRQLPYFGAAMHVATPLDLRRSMQNLGRNLCPKYQKQGCFKMTLMGQKYIVVHDPELIKDVFAMNSPTFGKICEGDAIFEQLKLFRGEGLTTISDGPLHDQCQKVVLNALQKPCFKRYVAPINEWVSKCLDELDTMKQPFDMTRFLRRTVFRVIGILTVGKDLFDPEFPKYQKFTKSLKYVVEESINRVFKNTDKIPVNAMKFKSEVNLVHEVTMGWVNEHVADYESGKRSQPEEWDLLDVMIRHALRSENGKDVFMDKELMRANTTTAMSAGHSTPTSMLSWCINYLYDYSLGNNDVLQCLLLEVEQISYGDRTYIPTFEDIYKRMGYMTNVLKETMRICPPIPSLIRHCKNDGAMGPYRVKKGDNIMISVLGTHMNSKVWSEPNVFDPTRFEHPLPANSYLPWAGGPRACIGRELALLVGRILFFQLLNRYTIQLDPSSEVVEWEHLFVFPKGLMCNVTKRRSTGKAPAPGAEPAAAGTKGERSSQPPPIGGGSGLPLGFGRKITLLFATNSPKGDVQDAYSTLYDGLAEQNFSFGKFPCSLDDYLPTIQAAAEQGGEGAEQLLLGICSSTYNGMPPSNRAGSCKAFFSWVNDRAAAAHGNPALAKSLAHVRFFVIGCGNSQWADTYQYIPKGIDSGLRALGAQALIDPMYFDASGDSLVEDFVSDCLPTIMGGLADHFGVSLADCGPAPSSQDLAAPDGPAAGSSGGGWTKTTPSKQLANAKGSGKKRRTALNQSIVMPQSATSAVQMQVLPVSPAKVRVVPTAAAPAGTVVHACPLYTNRNICAADYALRTVHVEIGMRDGMSYRAGDHLCVCPENPPAYVERVLGYFPDFDAETVIQWVTMQQKVRRFNLPLNVPMTVGNVLGRIVDLKAVPSKQFLANLSAIVEEPAHTAELQTIAGSTENVRNWLDQNKPVQIIDCLDMFPIQGRRFPKFLELLPLLKPRRYSISSSPKSDAGRVHLSVGVVEDKYPASSGAERLYHGTCSGYLETLDCSNPDNPPTLFAYCEAAPEEFDLPADDVPCVFISAGTGFAPMRGFLRERIARKAPGANYVITGCRSPTCDYIYSDELAQAQEAGFLAGLYPAFSRCPDTPKTYVQDVIARESDLLIDLLEDKGAYFYVCGSARRVGAGVQDALRALYARYPGASGSPEEYAAQKVDALKAEGRLLLDVWG